MAIPSLIFHSFSFCRRTIYTSRSTGLKEVYNATLHNAIMLARTHKYVPFRSVPESVINKFMPSHKLPGKAVALYITRLET